MGFTKKTKYYTGVVYEWNLPTGWTCPYAKECLVKVDKTTGKMDNKSNAYKCYAASSERFPAVRDSRWGNFEQSKVSIPQLPKKVEAVRIHASGDFYSQEYFDKWIEFCKDNKDVEFWAYTKSLNFWTKRLDEIPDNLTLTASWGGKFDYMIDKHKLKNALVIRKEMLKDNMIIDTNDDVARQKDVSFYLLDNNEK
jgi:hypothetical protein|tara:strand:- start:56 stop:643 length:588 start_codon:yes stop_codon:yes gene_type:complete